MKNYAQMIREIAYKGYDAERNLDYEGDTYMTKLQGRELDKKIRQMRKSAELFVVLWLIGQFKKQGYCMWQDEPVYLEEAEICRLEKEDTKEKVDIRWYGHEGYDLELGNIYLCNYQRYKADEYFCIKVSTKDSKAKHIFRIPQESLIKFKEKGCKIRWLRIICDPESGEVIDLMEYTDLFHQLKKENLDTVWYEPGYEPEKESDRLPDLFYEVMEKENVKNHLFLPQAESVKGRVTTNGDGYMYVSFYQCPTFEFPDGPEGEEYRWRKEYHIPERVRIKCTEDVPVLREKEVQIVLLPCFFKEDGVFVWLQIPEIRTEKMGAGLMPLGGFMYV